MKHLDVRHFWLQEELRNYKMKRIDRKFNASDMLTHSPSAEELRKFLPMIGCHTTTVKKGKLQCNQDDAEGFLAAKSTAFLANHFAADEFAHFSDFAGSDQMRQFHFLSVESACNLPSRSPSSGCVITLLI